jgi:hypothetical protein
MEERTMSMTRREAIAAGLALFPGSLLAQQTERWKIHEWGTFTALQDEQGAPLGWINTEDEPVPPFCHRLSKSLLVPVDDLAPGYFKDAPRCHPDVILRLETPVVYFHPPKSAKLPATVNLRVEFRGGWLTEYYPDAKVYAPGVQNRLQYGRLTSGTQGSLEWRGLQVGKEGVSPETKDAVWLSPRNVKCAPVTTAKGESEQFLFYRGVGYLKAPLLTRRSGDGKTLSLHGWLPADLQDKAPLLVPRLWLADIREDGTTAFRTISPIKLAAGREPLLASVPATFEEKDYSMARLGKLREEMRDGLTTEGLHTDEAEALLNTWDASYFRSHGMRLFFVVPRAYVDYVLPLKSSIDADVTRAMIGRLELITPAQRACLVRISGAKAPDSTWYQEWAQKNPEAWKRLQEKRQEGNLHSLREENIRIPDDYLAYLELGRFRNALVLDELKRRPTEGLRKFVDAYDLHEAKIGER